LGLEDYLREVFEEWLFYELPSDIVPRDLKYSLKEEVQAVIGPRRAGKTYFMYEVISDLLREGYGKRDLLYVDFEDPRLAGFKASDVGVFLRVVGEYFNWKPVLFLDEVQNVVGWSKFVRVLHGKGFKVFISGSSSKLLSREIASELRGRSRTIEVLTFSFREYLRAKGVNIRIESCLDESMIKNHLRRYLESGGYPRVVLSGDTSLLREYLDAVFYRDIIERHNVRDIASLRLFLRALLSALSTFFPINKVYNEFKITWYQEE